MKINNTLFYKKNSNDKPINLFDYESPKNEQSLYKSIPINYRWNPTIREIMMTGIFRIKYRGTCKYNYKRPQSHTIKEFADTFAIYPN